MFLFGILSSPLPYLLMAVFYFFGFATGMFKGNADSEPKAQVQEKNIQVEPHTKSVEVADFTFHFHDYSLQKKMDCNSVQPDLQPTISQKEKLIFFVHDTKIHHSPLSESYFCRPPPSLS